MLERSSLNRVVPGNQAPESLAIKSYDDRHGQLNSSLKSASLSAGISYAIDIIDYVYVVYNIYDYAQAPLAGVVKMLRLGTHAHA